MKRYIRFITPYILLIIFAGCIPGKTARLSGTGKDMGMVELVITPVASGKPLYMDSVYSNPKGERYSVLALRFFLSEIALAKSIGEEHRALPETPSGVYLMDFAQPDYDAGYGKQGCSIKFRVKTGNYSDLRFQMGVPRALNHSDPATASFPLDMGRGEMYWNWNSGYIFFLAEGKGADVYRNHFHLAIGSDARIMPFSVGNLFDVVPLIQVTKDKTTVIRFDLDLNEMMENPDQSYYSLNFPETAIVHGGNNADLLRLNVLRCLHFVSAGYR